jgi:DNA polymerase III subunit delta'
MRFSEIQGQEEIKRKLIQTVLDQRVSHAQLFYGPEGCGKLALAIAYAQFVNCTSPRAMDSCGTCPSCIKYQKLIHPDLHFIYPVATTKKVTKKPQSKHFLEDWRKFLIENDYCVNLQEWYGTIEIENKQGLINAEDCNDIITTLGYKSYESDYKVMIIWMPEKIYPTAAPKILKILEEPPEKTLFLLVCDDPTQMIATILSRTLMVRIPKLNNLPRRADEDNPVFFSSFRNWMLDCYNGKIPELITFISEISRTGRERQKSFLQYGLQTIAVCTSFNHVQKIPANADGKELEFIQKFSKFITSDNLPVFSELFNTAISHIERNAHAPTLFLDLSLKIVRLFKPNLLPL